MAAGRMFSAEYPADTNNKIVVNEATLRKFGIPLDKAIGQKLNFNMGEKEIGSLEIVGVVKDFHFEDLHKVIEPYAFFLNNGYRFQLHDSACQHKRCEHGTSFSGNKMEIAGS